MGRVRSTVLRRHSTLRRRQVILQHRRSTVRRRQTTRRLARLQVDRRLARSTHRPAPNFHREVPNTPRLLPRMTRAILDVPYTPSVDQHQPHFPPPKDCGSIDLIFCLLLGGITRRSVMRVARLMPFFALTRPRANRQKTRFCFLDSLATALGWHDFVSRPWAFELQL